MAKRYLTTTDIAQMQESATRHQRSATGPHQSTPLSTGRSSAAAAERTERSTVHSITSTPEALSVDMGRRMKIYGVQMALRVACFFGFVFIENWWWRIACVLGMVILPWSAVLLANAGADKSERTSSYLGPDLLPELESPRGPVPGQPHTAREFTATGEPGSMRSGAADSAVQEEDVVVDGEWSTPHGTETLGEDQR